MLEKTNAYVAWQQRCGIYIPCRSLSIASFYFDANVRKTPLQNFRTCDCGCFV